jgi:hypothetical protein
MTRRIGMLVWMTLLMAPMLATAETPLHGVAEFKIGGYYPAIDDEFGGASQPFLDVFSDGDLVYGELELDTTLWRGVGTLAAGFHLGYTTVKGNVLSTGDTSVSDTTSMTIVPLRASLVYRYDYSAKHHSIPLVPVLKCGLDYALWWVDGADGETASFGGNEASGGIMGAHGSVAIHLLLDIFGETSAANFDLNWGVNNSYFFAEYMITRIDNFSTDGFDLSDDIWAFGLAFEF